MLKMSKLYPLTVGICAILLVSCVPKNFQAIAPTSNLGIVDGQPISEAGDYEGKLFLPLVLVQMMDGRCSGTLIALDLVVTAAHCVSHPDRNPNDMYVSRLVRDGATTTWIKRRVRAYKAHPDYLEHSWRVHDIALLKLDDFFPDDTPVADLAPIPADHFDYFHYGPYYAAGFGIVNNRAGDFTQSLTDPHYFRIQGMDLESLQAFDADQTYYFNLKVTDRGALCFGDSGGPLMTYVNNAPTVFGVNSNIRVEYESDEMAKEFENAHDDPNEIYKLRKKYPDHRLCGWGDNFFVDVGLHREWIDKATVQLNDAEVLAKEATFNSYSITGPHAKRSSLTYMRSTWVVPQPPPLNSNQVITLGVGLGGGRGNEVRAVAKWGLGTIEDIKNWGVACFGDSLDPKTGQSQSVSGKLIPVEPGSEITQVVELVSQQDGINTYHCSFEGYADSLIEYKVKAPMNSVWVFYEAHDFQECLDYLAEPVIFKNIEVRSQDRVSNFKWSNGPFGVVDPMQCGMHVKVLKNSAHGGLISIGIEGGGGPS